MVKIKSQGNIGFYVFQNDHNPPHIHVRYKKQYEARISLEGVVLTNNGFTGKQLKIFVKFIEEYQQEFLEAWNDFHL